MPHLPLVLAIDDNAINRDILNEMLGGRFELHLAETGTEGLATARELRPDVVLLDVMLPDVDGREVCRRLRSLPEMANARIILVSARAMAREKEEGLIAGADAYLTKPFHEDELLAMIAGLSV